VTNLKRRPSYDETISREAQGGVILCIPHDIPKRLNMLRMLIAPLLVLSFSYPTVDQEPSHVIEVHAHRFAFEPESIAVHRGETIRLRLISDDVPHSLLVRGLGINESASKSHPGEIVFTASQTGDFAGSCGRFCGSGHGRMVFTVHVTGD
jgi:cytochrome c oxidase subunit II